MTLRQHSPLSYSVSDPVKQATHSTTGPIPAAKATTLTSSPTYDYHAPQVFQQSLKQVV